jgi:hypothetical protein
MEENQNITDNKGEENMAVAETTTTVVAPKEKLINKLKGIDKYKEKEYAQEEEAIDDALSLMDELDANSKEAEKFKQGMMQLISENPMLAYMIKEAQSGGNPMAAMQSLYDKPEDMMLKDGDEGYSSVQSRINERMKREAEDQNIMSKWEDAMQKFPETFNKWASDKNIPEEERNSFADFLSETMMKLATGEVDEDMLNRMWESFIYKKDVQVLNEDLNIANANAESSPEISKEPIMPIPESASTPPPKQPQQRKLNPLEQLKKANLY